MIGCERGIGGSNFLQAFVFVDFTAEAEARGTERNGMGVRRAHDSPLPPSFPASWFWF